MPYSKSQEKSVQEQKQTQDFTILHHPARKPPFGRQQLLTQDSEVRADPLLLGNSKAVRHVVEFLHETIFFGDS